MTETMERNEVREVTDADMTGLIVKKLAEVVELENTRKELSKKRQLAADNESDAKKAYENAVEELKDLQREMTGTLFDKPAPLLPTVFDDADNQAIRAIRIEDLPIKSDAVKSRLSDSDDSIGKPPCVTLGDLEEWTENGGRLHKIKTITDKKIPTIREAIREACAPFTDKRESEAA